MADKISHPKKRAFLAAFGESGNVSRSAENAGITRRRHYQWLLDDPLYAAAFEDAREQAADRMEEEARRRAVEGTERPVFYQGAPCGTIREYSDTLLIFLLKGARPETYRENVRTEHVGQGGGPIEHAVSFDAVRAAERAYRDALRAERGAVGGAVRDDHQPDAG